MLILPIKKQWYDMIATGQKKEEYRSITPYYATRFNKIADDNGDFVCMLRNGYTNQSPTMTVKVHLSIGYGNSDWGADPETEYYILSILDIINNT